MKQFFIINIFLSTFFASVLFSNTFTSGENKVSLVELYTSQGCSSCPPADEWLSDLKREDQLFKKFIPLAFHVTYWNYIGWNDVFANSKNDDRQKKYSRDIWKRNSVYTPQFIIDTKEYRQWFRNKNLPTFSNKYAGDLTVTLQKDNHLMIEYHNKNIKKKDVIIHIVLQGFDYSISIHRGENSNKKLKHDFVVLKHIKRDSLIQDNKLKYKLKLPFEIRGNNRKALVVWISDKNYTQLQAVGNYITY